VEEVLSDSEIKVKGTGMTLNDKEREYDFKIIPKLD